MLFPVINYCALELIVYNLMVYGIETGKLISLSFVMFKNNLFVYRRDRDRKLEGGKEVRTPLSTYARVRADTIRLCCLQHPIIGFVQCAATAANY